MPLLIEPLEFLFETLMEITTNGKLDGRVPYAQFKLNPLQQIGFYGVDFEKQLGGLKELADKPGIKTHHVGKMSSLTNPDVKKLYRFSLELIQWDFESWPDPEIIVMEVVNREKYNQWLKEKLNKKGNS